MLVSAQAMGYRRSLAGLGSATCSVRRLNGTSNSASRHR
jgi:hypothetical protein